MKALIKVIWFSLVLTFGDNVLKFVEIDSTNLSQKLITAVPYLEVLNISKFLEGITNNINNVLFFTLLFLGLDLIGGEMNGIIKGPFKLVFHTIFYVIGFGLIFTFIGLLGATINISFS